MKEFVEKLIERLEEEETKWSDIYNLDKIKGEINRYADGRCESATEIMGIVNKLAEEYNSELIEKINFAIEASNTNDNYMTGLRNGMRYCMALIDGKEPEFESCNQLAEEYMTCYKSCTECEAYDKEKHHCPKFCYIIEETVKEIEENHNGWIPCSERLPEDRVPVIVCAIGSEEGVFISYYSEDDEKWKYDTEEGISHYVNVIAWQPLPEAYKPEQQKKIPTDHFAERFNRVM